MAGAFPGFQTFVAGVGSTNTTYYAIEDANGTAWEVGLGTVTDASPDTLSRSTILASSTGSAISLSSGTHTVFATYPAGKAVYLDASGNLSHTVDISSDTNLAASTGITLTGDTLTTNDGQIVHDSLSGFVANEHIDHSGVSITAGTGLSGGGDLTSTRTLNVDASQTQITAVGTIATGTWAATDVAVAHGGTGASSAGDARTNLGLVIGTNVQAYDAQLATLAGLTADQVGGLVDLATLEAPGSDGQFIVATGSGAFAYESGATARASLGLSIGSHVQAYDADLAALAGVTSAANKIPYFTGSGSADTLSLKDEDDMASDSVYAVATQQSIKAYVASQITAEDLDVSTDSGTIDIDLNSETLTIAGGTGISTSGSSTTVTVAIDSTITTLSGSQTLTNKTLTSPIVSGLTLSDSSIILEGATIDGYETTITVTDPTADRTWTIPNATDTSVGRDTTDTLTNKTLTAPVINGAISGSSISTESDMDDGSGASNALLSSQLAIKTFVDNQISSVSNKQTTFVLQDGDGSSVTIADSKYVKFIEGNAIDINWTDTDNGTSGDPYDLTFSVSGYTGETSLVTTGALDSGTITSNFGDINTGSSNITTTGLISGGSLDIDNVLINGTNIGHTDDTDLLTLTSGALGLLGTFTVGVDDAGHNVQFYGHTASKYMQWESSSDSLRIYGDLRTQGYLKIFSTDQSDQTLYAKQVASQTGELILMENSSGTDLFVVSSAGVITTGTWQGTKIASGYIANDAIDSQHYAAASIDAEHLAPDIISGQTEVTSADADYLLVWDATDSALKKVDAGEFRGGGGGSGTMNAVKSNGSAVGGSDIVTLDFSSEFTTSESPDTEINISMAAAQTAITSLGTLTALTVDDVAIDGKVITMTGSTSDTAVFTVGTHGTLSIVTTDDAAAAANIQITADGTVDIDSAGVLTLDSGAAINIEPASGSAILLDGTISIDAGVVTGATSITSTAFVGDITGDVTGNADTATVATSFTASANNSTDETVYPVFVDGATGTQGAETDTGLTYNPSTGTVTSTVFVGALTGNVTGNASGSSGSCTGNAATATEATNVTVSANNSTDETVYPVFVDGATGTQGAETDTGLTYNPSSGLLTAAAFSGPLTGNVTGNASGTAATVTGGTQAAITSAANLVTVGTIGTGVWQGTAVALGYGGTGLVGATDGKIVVADGSGAPVAVQAFTDNDGTLKHEVGGIEADISGIAVGDVLAGTGSGAIGIVTSSGHSDGDVLTLQADGTADWETASSGGMTAFILEDDSGDEVSISNAEEVKFIGAGGLTINWTDTSPGSDGDPFDLTFTIGTLNQDTTGTAAIATTVTITDNENTNEENAITFTSGGDVDGGNIGLESDGDLTYNPSTGTVTATIFKGNIDAVDGDFDGTLEADAITLGGTALGSLYSPIAGSSSIVTVGTVSTGTWQGTAIAHAYIGNDAIDGDNIADDSVNSEHYVDGSIDTAHIADNQVTLAKMAGLARGSIIYGDSSGDPAALAISSSSGHVLKSDGTDISWGAVTASVDIDGLSALGGTGLHQTQDHFMFSDNGTEKKITFSNLEDAIFANLSGDATVAAGGAITLAAAQTNITSLGTLTALTVDDVAVDGKVITMTGSTDDTAVFTVGTHGTLSIVTTDTAAAAANIQITADGTVDIDSAGVLTLDSGAAINIEPASGSAILLDGTISIDAGVVTGATSITSTAFVGNVTGNASGTAATVTGAAQSNITSLGTLTALTVDDIAVDGKVITMTGSTDDTAVITVGTHGTLSIVTTDDAAAAANIQITADGTVDIDSAGVLTLDSGAAINIEPASGSAILLDGTISIDAGVVTGATSITSTAFVGDITGDVTGNADTATVATTVTITDNEDTNEENAVVFTAGGDVDGGNLGLESDGHLTYNPSNGTVTATIFKGNIDAVDGDFDGTLEADAITLGGTALGSLYSPIAGSSSIVTVGTVGTGTWQGTAIAGGYIANDAIDSQHYADGSIDNAHIADDAINSEHYAAGSIDTAHIADDQVTLAKMAGITRGSIIYGDASGNPAALAISSTDGHVLKSDGTDISWGAVTATVSGNVFATDLKVGRDAHNLIDFTTDDNIVFRAGNEDQLTLVDGALTPSSNAIVDLGTDALEFKDGYFDGTLEADAITIGGTAIGSIYSAIAGSSSIVTTGALDSGSITSGFGNIDNGGSSIACGSLDISDGNITNVGDIDCDSISIADAGTGLNIAFGGNTTLNKMTLTDNLADALNVTEGSNSYIKICTTNGSTGNTPNAEKIHFGQAVVGATNTATDGGSVTIDCSKGNYHEILMNADASAIAFTNAAAGQRIVVRVKQHSTHIDLDATHGWNSVTVNGSSGTLHFPGGTEPTLTEANNAIDMFGFIFTSTVTTVHGFVLGQDIKA